MQMAVVEIGLQLAPAGQTLPSRRVMPCSSSLALQMSAHWVGVLEGGFSSTHCAGTTKHGSEGREDRLRLLISCTSQLRQRTWGVAVAGGGTSVGHGRAELQAGEQKEPGRPVIVVFSLPLAHGPLKGLP